MIQEVEEHTNLLQFLKKELPFSNREMKRRLEKGFCKVNGIIERFGSTRLKPKDTVSFENRAIQKSKIQISILYEDENYYVLNKPIDFECSQQIFDFNFPNSKLIHRLDKQTSGVMLLAKNSFSQKILADLFRKKEMDKTYLAYVDKVVGKNRGEISSYLIRKGFYQGQTLWGSNPCKRGCFSTTHWELLEKRSDYSVLRCHPKTGRTHQIRVHLKEMGHPILGDFHYCRRFTSSFTADRLYLHSEKISFHCPFAQKRVTFFAKSSF